jgi:hypothetical protein
MFKVLKAIRAIPELGGLNGYEAKRIRFSNTVIYLWELFNKKSCFARMDIDSEYPEKRIEILFRDVPETKQTKDLKNRLVFLTHKGYSRKERVKKYNTILLDYEERIISNGTAEGERLLPKKDLNAGFWWS